MRVLAMVAAAAWSLPACILPASAQTLSVGVGAAVSSIDPHYYTLTPNEQLHAHVFERLVEMDPQARPVPGLADSWKLIDDRTWEFHLRDATFHDGTKLTAEDVAYTIARVPTVPNSPGSFAIYVKPITGVEVVDAHTIRLRTASVYPLLPIDLSQVFVIPRGLGPNPLTEEFNSGKNAIGTGPYRFVSYKPGDRIELERNDAYWGRKPDWQHITWRIMSNDAGRTAALLSGDVGLIDSVPTSDIAKLSTDKRVSLWQIVSLRLIFLTLDQSRDGPTPFVTGPNGEILAKNPLKDRRVREALSIAVNRPAMVERVMENAAIPTGQFLPPGSFSYVPGLNPPQYDIARAKALLAEAGFPNGLRITIHGSNDRYLNDAKIVQAVGQMWSRIGVQASVETQPWSSYVGHTNKQDFSVFLSGWAISSGEASNPLRSLVATFDAAKGRGAVNRGRYSNPVLDALIDQAVTIADDGAREKALMAATRMVMEDVALIPLHNQKNTWATKAGLTYVPRADEETHAFELRSAN
jgi:peptide/nickel transport system substrate-binding protein